MSAIKPSNPNSLVRKTGSIILNILGLVVGIVAIMSIWFNQGATQNKKNLNRKANRFNRFWIWNSPMSNSWIPVPAGGWSLNIT